MAFTGSGKNATIFTAPMVDQASSYHFSSGSANSDSDTSTSSSFSSFSSCENEILPSSATVISPKKKPTKKLSSKKKKPLSFVDKILFLTKPLIIVVIIILFFSLIFKGKLNFTPFSSKIDVSKSPPGGSSSSAVSSTSPPSSPKPKKMEFLPKSDPRSPEYDGIYSFLIGYKEDMTTEEFSVFKNELESRCLDPKKNGDMNLPCATGYPLVHAVLAMYPSEIIDLLIKHDACICKKNARTMFSGSSLMYAILLSRWDIAEYFLGYGDKFLDLTVRNSSFQSVAEYLIITCSGYDIPPLLKKNILRRTKDQLIRTEQFGLRDMLLYKEFNMVYDLLESNPDAIKDELERLECRYSILAIAFWVGATDNLVAKILDHPNIVVDWNLYQEDDFLTQNEIKMEGIEPKNSFNKIKKPPGLDERLEHFKALYGHVQTIKHEGKSRRGSVTE